MTSQEKRLLGIAGAIFILYVVPFEVAPGLWQWGKSLWSGQQQQELQIAQLERLSHEDKKWREEHELALKQLTKLKSSLLEGVTEELINARLQRLLKNHSKTAKVQLKSQGLPEFAATGDWLLITQAIHFDATSQQLMTFLQLLKNDPITLSVVSMELQEISKNKVRGNLKITGFSKKPIMDTAEEVTE
ncbi:hypothetical protein [Candidatus Venteria ishoeyi]|nr:hypothetical protein [Candidatus Venteria ishoeyi]MDM8548048.1 hypothetical protein [Candidatus Venteria ishoeyi]